MAKIKTKHQSLWYVGAYVTNPSSGEFEVFQLEQSHFTGISQRANSWFRNLKMYKPQVDTWWWLGNKVVQIVDVKSNKFVYGVVDPVTEVEFSTLRSTITIPFIGELPDWSRV